jgi:hypothetical protein
VLAVAAGAGDGVAVFDDRPHDSPIRSSLRERTEAGTPVQVRTVASLVPDDEAARLRLVKIDVEGHEVAVLRGLIPLFELGARPAVLVELHAGVVEEAVVLLFELGARYGLNTYDLRTGRHDDPWQGTARGLARRLEPLNERHVLLAS